MAAHVRLAIAALAYILVGLAGCSTSATPSVSTLPSPLPPQSGCSVATAPDPLCVVVLGDSISYGTPLEGADRWPSRLERLLASALPKRAVSVANWGVPGSRVDVLAAAAMAQPHLETFDIAIVIEGVNDAAWSPIDTWQLAYEAAIQAMERSGVTVVIGTPPPTLEANAFTARYDATTAALRSVAGSTRPLLDIDARWRRDGAAAASAYYSDLIHQSAAGQQLMAELASEIVLDLLERRVAG